MSERLSGGTEKSRDGDDNAMDKVVLLDTAMGSTNRGDEIIMQCAKEELSDILAKYYTLSVPTHVRAFGISECIGKLPDTASEVADAKYKFVCGTNLLSSNMFHRTNQWDINLLNVRPIRDSILVGVGGAASANLYTQWLYKRVLSKKYIHSVRDENAFKLVTGLGLKCVNTGCVTMWKLSPTHCKGVSKEKAEDVVFTLTDYNRNPVQDKKMLDALKNNYRNMFFWIQGAHDYEYLQSIEANTDYIHIIPSDVHSYEKVLRRGVLIT